MTTTTQAKPSTFILVDLAHMSLEQILSEYSRVDTERLAAGKSGDRARHGACVRYLNVISAIGDWRYPEEFNEWDTVR